MVARMHGVKRHVFVASRRDAAGGFWREAEQRFDSAAGALAGAQFQHLAEQHEHGDDGSRFKVNRRLAAVT
jgi:hypothetical protein